MGGGSVGISGSKQRSSSESPFQGLQRDTANQLQALLEGYIKSNGGQFPVFPGITANYNDLGLGSSDILAGLLGGSTSPVGTASNSALMDILSGKSAVPTTDYEDALDARRRRQLADDFAGINEQLTGGGLRFSTANERLKSEAALRSQENFLSQVSPVRAQLQEAARARQAGALGELGQLGIGQQQIGLGKQSNAISDTRAQQVGYLPYIMQFLNAGTPQQRSKGSSYAASYSK